MNIRMPEPVALDFSWVVEQGRARIDQVLANLDSYVAKALVHGATWHPTGFMVLPLWDIEGLGLVRLHIWSEGLRPKREGNPEIHSHCFHLTSYVLEGLYVEHQYSAQQSSGEDAVYRGYNVVPPVGDGLDRITPDGSRYRVQTMGTESTPAGEFHNLPAGIHHMTDIGDEPAATIALISRPQPGQADHLLGFEDHNGLESLRSKVDRKLFDFELRRLGIAH